ncbi:MAG: glucose-6-phosphate isomerase [Rhodobacterales bacterium]|nr:MAG: glucose-6-phosphate isomerase [Rhodobacterales bacterium]
MNVMWKKLEAARDRLQETRIEALLAARGSADFTLHVDGLVFDYSKTLLDAPARSLLLNLIESSALTSARTSMFSGGKINQTEGRAVLHTALRSAETTPLLVDGKDVRPGITEVRARMGEFADALRSGALRGATGARFTDVVNIGIGGSDLGPAMATGALAPYADGPRLHFISNVDPAHLADTLAPLDPATTLVLIASKTFTTIETMTNAAAARDWLAAALGEAHSGHLAAVSSALDKTAAWGIAPERVFGFEDWVGGRYSLWGPIGLPLRIAIGGAHFDAFLAGAAAMDAHFQQAEGAQNLPVMLALIGIWHHQVMGYPTRAVLPYEQRLARLPAYLQQLEMESNGKSVAMDGRALERPAGPVVWGEPGTNGQHAFFQLIHQGKVPVPCEFMVGAAGHEAGFEAQHDLLVANCLAQSEALMRGRSLEEARARVAAAGYGGAELERQAAHRVFPGNRPSTTLLYPKLTPYVLGQILALYEHRVFVEGVLLGINSFDQWGVELGKELASRLAPVVAGEASAQGLDASTRGLIAALQQMKGKDA